MVGYTECLITLAVSIKIVLVFFDPGSILVDCLLPLLLVAGAQPRQGLQHNTDRVFLAPTPRRIITYSNKQIKYQKIENP